MDINKLTHIPVQHPDSCLSLSIGLLKILYDLFSPFNLVLSIGSGPGVLEATLQEYISKQLLPRQDVQQSGPTIQGLEVLSSSINPNKYLPEENMHFVKGTWELCPIAAEADAWIFCYPREPKLVRKYMQEFAHGRTKALTIVWLGPGADWEDYQDIFSAQGKRAVTVKRGLECGVAEYEMMAVTDIT